MNRAEHKTIMGKPVIVKYYFTGLSFVIMQLYPNWIKQVSYTVRNKTVTSVLYNIAARKAFNYSPDCIASGTFLLKVL